MEVSIKVVGVGGGGNRAVNHMYNSGMGGVEFLAIDTSLHTLDVSKAACKLNIGCNLTRGTHTSGMPEIGEKAAEESREKITDALKGADMVFIIATMGGGTGTGAAPIVAEIARDLGCLTMGVVTRPYAFEGKDCIRRAGEGIDKLKDKVDALLVISDEQLKCINPKITFANAYEVADEVLRQAVQGISDLINIPGTVNLDFVDVVFLMKGAGFAHIGLGRAKGEDCAKRAAKEAIASPLLETSIHGARGIIVLFQMSPDIRLKDVDEAAAMIHDAASEEANLLWGAIVDESMEDECRVTIIATDFEETAKPVAADTAQASSTDAAAILKEET